LRWQVRSCKPFLETPLAEPGVVGVSSGAALGASTAIVFGISATGGGVALLAFLGGLGATLLVYAVARAGGRTEVVTLLLTGIAINAFAQAGLAFVLFVADTASREQIVFWQLGSLAGSVWSEVVIVLPVLILGTVLAVLMAHRLDLLALGERNARHLGVDVEQLRIIAIVLVALLTGVAVAFAGIIAFVGLVVPPHHPHGTGTFPPGTVDCQRCRGRGAPSDCRFVDQDDCSGC